MLFLLNILVSDMVLAVSGAAMFILGIYQHHKNISSDIIKQRVTDFKYQLTLEDTVPCQIDVIMK